jgi:hypothetical protein
LHFLAVESQIMCAFHRLTCSSGLFPRQRQVRRGNGETESNEGNKQQYPRVLVRAWDKMIRTRKVPLRVGLMSRDVPKGGRAGLGISYRVVILASSPRGPLSRPCAVPSLKTQFSVEGIIALL